MKVSADAPFTSQPHTLVVPDDMAKAPRLDPRMPSQGIAPKTLLLVNPFYPKDPHASYGKHALTPTLALTSVAAAAPSDWTVSVWDENLIHGAPPHDPVPQVVGITVHLTFAKRAYELARYYRARGAKVILGGLHVISCPDDAAPHGDAIALGDGVALLPRMLRDLERGELAPRYHADFDGAYREDPAPRRDLLPRRSFLTTTSVNATRGCHNRCGFCYLSTDGLRMPYRMRDPDQIVREIVDDGQPYVVFTDNNLGSNRAYLHKLCAALQRAEIIWSAAVTIDVTDDPSLVRAMAMSGCTGVFIGFESLEDENLRDARKKTPRAEDYARRVRLLHDNGIQVNGSFVLGFDHDRKDVFAKTAEWIEDVRLECATFHVLTPYPGTPLYHSMKSEGRLLHEDYDRYDTAHAVFRPKHMTPEELERGYGWMYERLFSHTSIWKRRPTDARAVLPYLAMSYLYKRSNPVWHALIANDLVHAVWSPLVERTRRRHMRFREELAARKEGTSPARRALTVVSASV